jgi:hypothetical protein
MQTNKPADYPITAGGKIKRAIFAIIPLLHGFCCEVPYGQVAQSVEQRIENPRVGSSILPLATIHILSTI